MSFAVFGPMPETRRNGASSSAATASAIWPTVSVDEHAERGLRPDPRDAEQLREDLQLVARLEAEQRQGVLAHDETRVQRQRLADVRRARDLRRDGDGEPDSARPRPRRESASTCTAVPRTEEIMLRAYGRVRSFVRATRSARRPRAERAARRRPTPAARE